MGFSTDYTFSVENVKERRYGVYARASESITPVLAGASDTFADAFTKVTDGGFTKIGGCEKQPTLKEEPGESKELSDGDLVVFNNLVFKARDMQLTGASYDALKALVRYPFDVVMVDSKSKTIKYGFGFQRVVGPLDGPRFLQRGQQLLIHSSLL